MMPNVSAIYRDLTYIANPALQPKSIDYNSPPPSRDLFMEKQSRHNELMEKLRNAQRESNSISSQLQGSDSYSSNNTNKTSYTTYDNYRQGQDYNRNANYFL